MRETVALACLALVLAAGCSQPQAESSEGAFAGLTDDVEVTATTGAIAGVVVDEAIRPIANATVSLQNPSRNATTDADGRFAFEDLPAGTYFLAASARRHEPTQVSVDVAAGDASAVRILLVASNTAEPYSTTLQFRG